MRIIAWNCNMAFRKKAAAILAYKPHLVVLPECECPDNLIFEKGIKKPKDILWFGNNKHKGIAIISYSDLQLRLIDKHNTAFKHVIPIAVTGKNVSFNLFAIWANNPGDKEGQYVTQVWKAIHYYDDLLTNTNCILMGDFNSNTIWDKKRRPGNHSNVVQVLEQKNIHSAYHAYHKQVQGKEMHPTQFMYRHKDKPYHLDYCFVSAGMGTRIKKVEIGAYDEWCMHSDHMPVMVSFKRF